MRYLPFFIFNTLVFLSLKTFAQDSQASLGKKTLNPDISVNILTSYRNAKRQGAKSTDESSGLALDEIELQFFADVDPYLKASALLSIHPSEGEHNTTEETSTASEEMTAESEPPSPEEKSWAIEPEEVFVETTQLPFVTFKIGKFRAALGRHNTLHMHAYPFIDAPLVHQKILGEEGLADTGISLSALMPALPWFSELTAQGLQGNSPVLFSSPSTSDLASVYRLRNLFDINDDTTFDLGFSESEGANFYAQHSYLRGADLSIKWRPNESSRQTSVILSAEYLRGTINGRSEERDLEGYAAWLQWQLSKRWWVQVRNEEVNNRDELGSVTHKISVLIGFFASEFSRVRFQIDKTEDQEDKSLVAFSLQGNMTIGAHPAHAY